MTVFLRRVLLLLPAALVCCASPALADVEPNNYPIQAEGPIPGGTTVKGTVTEDSDNHDLFVFYAAGGQQLHIVQQSPGIPDTDCIPKLKLLDADGHELTVDYTTPTTAPVARYFVDVVAGQWFCGAKAYAFRIDPAPAVTTGPAIGALTGTAEPNEGHGQATGPLAGNSWFWGTKQTENDEDWLFFYTAPGTRQIDISVTGVPTGPCPGGAKVDAGVTVNPNADPENNSNWISTTQVDYGPSEIGHMRITSKAAALVFLRVATDLNCGWAIRIDPADALASSIAPASPPPSTTTTSSNAGRDSAACRTALVELRTWKRVVHSRARMLRRAHGRRKRAHYRRLLRHAKARVRREYDNRRRLCGY